MRVVIALGGNALARRGEPLEAGLQRARAGAAAATIAAIARHHEVLLTHGNGPQVGLLALQADAYREVEGYPLDVLNAESQGMIGYWLLQALDAALPEREVVCLLTQVEVDPDDPAWSRPSKPIGPIYDDGAAKAIAERRGWSLAHDGGGWRRVVPSPRPRAIRGSATILRLVESGVLVICGGGGGVAVTAGTDGTWIGMEAVVDKDRTAALLALTMGADRLLIATDVEGVYPDWPRREGGPLRHATADEIAGMELDPGTMGPKVEAACAFARAGGRATIGALEDLPRLLEGSRGTTIRG
jgi:carbamate kinase